MLSDKKLKQIEKSLDKDKLDALLQSQPDELESAIVRADGAIKQASDELEANPQYIELKENLKVLSLGLREVKKRQNAIVQFALHLLEEKGKDNV